MRIKIYAKLLFVSIFIGASFNLAAYAVNYFSAPTAAAWRFSLAALLILILLYHKERMNLKALKSNVFLFVLLGIIGVFGFNMLFFIGMKTTSPLHGALIMATNPMLTTLLARYIAKDTLTSWQGIGIVLSLLGVLLVITNGSWEVVSTLSFSVGDLFMAAGNVCWALYGVLSKRFVRGSTSLATTAYTMTIGAVCLLLFAPSAPSTVPISDIPLTAWGAVVFMAIFTSVLGYLWWNNGISELGVGKTSVFFNLVPVVTLLLSMASGASITFVQILGTALVISGVLSSMLRKQSQETVLYSKM